MYVIDNDVSPLLRMAIPQWIYPPCPVVLFRQLFVYPCLLLFVFLRMFGKLQQSNTLFNVFFIHSSVNAKAFPMLVQAINQHSNSSYRLVQSIISLSSMHYPLLNMQNTMENHHLFNDLMYIFTSYLKNYQRSPVVLPIRCWLVHRCFNPGSAQPQVVSWEDVLGHGYVIGRMWGLH